jgi:hypothetical protein
MRARASISAGSSSMRFMLEQEIPAPKRMIARFHLSCYPPVQSPILDSTHDWPLFFSNRYISRCLNTKVNHRSACFTSSLRSSSSTPFTLGSEDRSFPHHERRCVLMSDAGTRHECPVKQIVACSSMRTMNAQGDYKTLGCRSDEKGTASANHPASASSFPPVLAKRCI